MQAIYITEAKYTTDYKIHLKFNTGESGEADLEHIIGKYKVAKPLLAKDMFADFYLDSWPTLAWNCGFDIAPESLYTLATGKTAVVQETS